MKRKRDSHASGAPHKKARRADPVGQSANATPTSTDHPVLRRLYPEVWTLRHYLLSQLPRSSKNRRRRLCQLGLTPPAGDGEPTSDIDRELGQLLDSTLIGCSSDASSGPAAQTEEDREREIKSFTQQRSQSTSGATYEPGYFRQSEQSQIVDFVVWLLFRRSTSHKPSHILCHGFQRTASTSHAQVAAVEPTSSIPGLIERTPNSHVRALKVSVWCRLQAILGCGGDKVIMDMLLECAMFRPVEGGTANYFQLSGNPISDVRPDKKRKDEAKHGDMTDAAKMTPLSASCVKRSPGVITFVRSRMLYAKAALNAKGGVRFGMRHIHVLNRFPKRDERHQTIHILRYIFPRQFGLHNVFTSKVDPRETAMPFKDYTLREKEIHQSMCKALGGKATDASEATKWKSRVPKRLRGAPLVLMDRLRTLNHRCSYVELLRHYCPVQNLPLSSKPEWKSHPLPPRDVQDGASKSPERDDNVSTDISESRHSGNTCFTDMACSTADVSGFCRAVVARVIPNGFWGSDNNKRTIMYWIDQFVSIRRFESLTLHQVTQNIEVALPFNLDQCVLMNL
ncbi:hypothetical protein BKA63DRAFT_54667 [Paraphoma chrysanthemicola]|nr:hypothetical protein BKA63DRAFT_54667 [Paraphoma chrysanthemicola]